MKKEYLIYKLSEDLKEATRIENELFKKFDVKRGLRNEDGTLKRGVFFCRRFASCSLKNIMGRRFASHSLKTEHYWPDVYIALFFQQTEHN